MLAPKFLFSDGPICGLVPHLRAGEGDAVAGGTKFKLKTTEPTEAQLHASVARFLDHFLLKPAFWTTFPAGWGLMTKATAGRLKRSGLKPGMPDLLVFFAGKTTGIELKTRDNKPSAAQLETFHTLQHAGVPVYCCWTIEEVIWSLKGRGIPLRPIAAEIKKCEPLPYAPYRSRSSYQQGRKSLSRPIARRVSSMRANTA